MKVGIIYFSGTGVTEKLVKQCAMGIQHAQGTAEEWKIEGNDIQAGRYIPPAPWSILHECAGLIFAAPTYMGGPAAEFKAFADRTSDFWIEQTWSGKMAAGMTCGTGFNGDQSSTLQYFCTLASQHGMLWLTLDTPYGVNPHGVNRLGTQLGVVAQAINGEPHEADIKTAYYLGKKITQTILGIPRVSRD